jgi:hypothetical protein
MRQIYLFIFLTLCTYYHSMGQRTGPYLPGQSDRTLIERLHYGIGIWDVGFNFGTAHALTDISGYPEFKLRLFLYDTQWSSTGAHAGMFARYRYSDLLGFTVDYNLAKLTSADSLGHRSSRGYAFRNRIFEASLNTEVYFLKSPFDIPVDVYGYIGFAFFYNDPKVYLHGSFVRDLDEFSKIQPAIPLGLGVIYTVNRKWNFGGNIGWRKLFTNYLDGLETIENGKNDSYYFMSLNVSYRLIHVGR